MQEKFLKKADRNKSQDRAKSEQFSKPFLKWAGGKSQLLDSFRVYYPDGLKSKTIEKYYEPFLGGGAVFFEIAQYFGIKSAVLYDVNKELILTYRVVQKDVFKLIEALEKHQKNYKKLDDTNQTKYFYALRERFNLQKGKTDYRKYSEKWVERAAQTLFLNKTCFNGLFRFNSKGEFNTPQGRYRNPKILDEKNLLKASELLGIAEIANVDFRQIETDIQDNAFVYYDPPYRPISKTSSFTSYSKFKFTDEDQRDLSKLFQRLDKIGVHQMLSNSDPKNNDPEDQFFDELYKNYHIFRVPAKRMINSNPAKRKAINEIIVTNYPVV